MTMASWWEWRATHWGCKWDASFADSGPMFAMGVEGMDVETTKETQRATITPDVAVYKFDTPWAPPVPFVEAASEQYPGLEFVLRFAEAGEGYAGEVRYVAGVCIEEEELEIDDVLLPEEQWF
jgi:hypothetical protein